MAPNAAIVPRGYLSNSGELEQLVYRAKFAMPAWEDYKRSLPPPAHYTPADVALLVVRGCAATRWNLTKLTLSRSGMAFGKTRAGEEAHVQYPPSSYRTRRRTAEPCDISSCVKRTSLSSPYSLPTWRRAVLCWRYGRSFLTPPCNHYTLLRTVKSMWAWRERC